MEKSISFQDIIRFAQNFDEDPRHNLALNAVTQAGVDEVAVNRDVINRASHTFSHWIETPDATNQKNSGRCWLFAGLNTLRLKAMQKMNLEQFELSQAYLMYWDKLEKANYFLESILDTCGEPLEGRLVAHLLTDPVPDGGQWDMFVNLVKKYGVVPKVCMPETFSSSKTAPLNYVLVTKLRENAMTLRTMHEQGVSTEVLSGAKEEMMNGIYRILTIHLGKPPASFLWEWRDKDKQFHRHANDGGFITPQEFFAEYVDFDLDDMVCLINAPTKDKPYRQMYTVQYLGNVVGGQNVRYLNVDMLTLKSAARDMIVNGRPVWFGCDVGKFMRRDLGILDADVYDYSLVYDLPFKMDKAARLDYGHSRMTHAMLLTGVDLDVVGNPIKWRVENSWGTELGDKGTMIMSDRWFDEYLYEVMVTKEFVPQELLPILETSPVVLPPWDPMGALAKAV